MPSRGVFSFGVSQALTSFRGLRRARGIFCSSLLLGVMAEHVRHTADVGGVEVCALGGDMDGIDPNPAIPDVSFVQRLVPALKKKGFHESEIEKIFSGNVLRVYQEILK